MGEGLELKDRIAAIERELQRLECMGHSEEAHERSREKGSPEAKKAWAHQRAREANGGAGAGEDGGGKEEKEEKGEGKEEKEGQDDGTTGDVVFVQFRKPSKLVAITPQKFERRYLGYGAATRVQIPLRLAWSITIHKSQGMAIDWLEVSWMAGVRPYSFTSCLRELTIEVESKDH